MLRSVIAVVAGVVIGSFLIFGIEALGHALWPATMTPDLHTAAGLRADVAVLPFGAKASVVIGWFLGAFAGAATALAVAHRWAPAAWVVAATFLALTAVNFSAAAHPIWMMLAAPIATLGAGRLAIAALRGRYGPPSSAAGRRDG